MIDKYVAQAPTQEAAIQKGLEAVGITKEEAKITVQDPGKKGFLGIGQRDAIVVVERLEKKDLVSDLLEPIKPLDVAPSKPQVTAKKENETKKAAENLTPAPEKDKVQATEHAQTAKKDEVQSAKSATDNLHNEEYEETMIPAEQDQAAIEAIADYLEMIVRAMKIDDVEVFVSRVDNFVTYDIETESAGLVIGRHGKVLNGLQILAQNHMHQLAHSKLFVKVDAEKYRERRKSTVERLADRTAEKVVQTGQRVSLNPMPAHERKQIHRYLNHYTGVQTYSEGKEPYRYLVVEPLDDEE
ncbi:RNA-binding cell elongation regulator Jag/EloR [Allofustis seminis]|uniref:RNA-binding cell elongation regulator Jag/EloR n=1 Tax=Allofustis seminis TaxID=166939 RepID=UPI0003829036|nr:RNA-binding cell elongation regulator Jag/EloR [Allofustis seminis]